MIATPLSSFSTGRKNLVLELMWPAESLPSSTGIADASPREGAEALGVEAATRRAAAEGEARPCSRAACFNCGLHLFPEKDDDRRSILVEVPALGMARRKAMACLSSSLQVSLSGGDT